jgi:chromosome segregation ATPase
VSRIIDADTAMLRDALHEAIEGRKQADNHAHDAIANVDRLTAQVESVRRDRDGWMERCLAKIEEVRRLQEALTTIEQERGAARMQVEVERGERRKAEQRLQEAYERIEYDQQDINALVARVQSLEETLTACEQERDTYWNLGQADRQRADESAAKVKRLQESIAITDRNFRAMQKRHDDYRDQLIEARAWMDDVAGEFRTLGYDQAVKRIDAVLAPAAPVTIVGRTVISKPGDGIEVTQIHLSEATKEALSTGGARIPPAETPAPASDSNESDADYYKRKWSAQLDLSAKLDADNDRLRAELEAERKRVEEALGQIDADRIRHFNECKEREAEIARLREDVNRHAAQRAHWSNVVGKNAGIHDELAATKARLGRATAALQEALGFIDLHAHIYGVKDARELKARSRAILVDDESKAAGEAWRVMKTALREIAESGECSSHGAIAIDALAKADARRGKVKP